MHSNTFHFDGHNLSDFGCIICNFENNDGITVEGGNIEYITTKTPNSNKNSQVGNEYADPYRFTFSIMKSVCQANHGEDYFTIPEQAEILKWLVKENGYGIFYFDGDDIQDICYFAYIDAMPHYINDCVYGFDLTVTTNAPCGFTTEYKKIYTIGKSQSIPLMVHHDVLRYCYPQVTITATSNISELTIRNSADKFLNSTLRIKNISNGKTIIIDNENGQISGINYDYFNWVFFRLVDGINNLEIVSDGTFQLEIKYRETRRIR